MWSDLEQGDQLLAVQPGEVFVHPRDAGVRRAPRENRLIVHAALYHEGRRKHVHSGRGEPVVLRSTFRRGLIAFAFLRKTAFLGLALPSTLAYRSDMGDLDRLVPSGIIEQWVYHLRRQRSRATDAIWLIDQGFTLHDGQDGVPQHDATARWRAEQETVVAEVTALLALYDGINLGTVDVEETA